MFTAVIIAVAVVVVAAALFAGLGRGGGGRGLQRAFAPEDLRPHSTSGRVG